MDALAARWPTWHARLATFLMDDPLRATRDELSRRLAEAEASAPQQELFPPAADAGRTEGAT
jgi:hypothetical protein